MVSVLVLLLLFVTCSSAVCWYAGVLVYGVRCAVCGVRCAVCSVLWGCNCQSAVLCCAVRCCAVLFMPTPVHGRALCPYFFYFFFGIQILYFSNFRDAKKSFFDRCTGLCTVMIFVCMNVGVGCSASASASASTLPYFFLKINK